MMNDIAKTSDNVVMIPSESKYDRLMELAISSDADVSKLEKLMDLQERYEANEAKKAYVSAMAEFQRKRPIIKKNKTGHNYKYASLSQIESQIKSVLTECGLSYRFEQSHHGNEIQVACIVTHVLGHSERTMMSAEADTSGSKNAVQAIGSTNAYLQRYTLIGALGITTADEDDDAMKASVVNVENLKAYTRKIGEHFYSIYAIKEALAEDNLDYAAECWNEISQEDKDILRMFIFRSQTLTTEEGEKIKNDPEKRFVTRIKAK